MHLKQTYGFINPTQLAENYNKMTAPLNFQDPIETLFKKLRIGSATPMRARNHTRRRNMLTLPFSLFSTQAPSQTRAGTGNDVHP
jgi:hypothetical protein